MTMTMMFISHLRDSRIGKYKWSGHRVYRILFLISLLFNFLF